MIFVNKNKILLYNKKKYKCSIGLNGLTDNKIEGDKKTPIGIYSLGELFVRTDRINNLKTKYKIISIEKDMAWSDDPNDLNYNKLIKIKNYHKECLFRKDNIYDLILVINYNTSPIIPNKGSAIFLHVSSNNYKPTSGCIAININDFIEIIELLSPNEKITIS
ncbi:MAG: L,D-transpeptidase family protein [Alphaproteobacteria bacterium]|tara:strand:+ start:142 stop:630 length:489 start_codon:yes stop_codon:yes gene_type:complete